MAQLVRVFDAHFCVFLLSTVALPPLRCRPPAAPQSASADCAGKVRPRRSRGFLRHASVAFAPRMAWRSTSCSRPSYLSARVAIFVSIRQRLERQRRSFCGPFHGCRPVGSGWHRSRQRRPRRRHDDARRRRGAEPLLGGMVADAFGFRMTFLLLGAISVGSLALWCGYARTLRRQGDSSSVPPATLPPETAAS